jgi:polyferredoxin
MSVLEAPPEAAQVVQPKQKKPYHKRLKPDTSQKIRRAIQLSFLLLNVAIGAQFYLFVRSCYPGSALSVSRPAGVEGWLPIAGMMNAKYWFLTGFVPAIHPAAMVLFLTFLVTSLLLRKAFCGWLCPVGTISEYLWKLGRDTFKRNFALPRWLDIPLRSLKYILLGFFLWAVSTMSAAAIGDFLRSPYGLIADVKMMLFFQHLSVGGAITIFVLVIGSVFVKNFWCRFLCPYGAMMGLAARFSPMRVTRQPELCIDCAKCAKACPSNLAVDKLIQIQSVECLGCMECVAVCPAERALEIRVVGSKRPVSPLAFGLLVIFLFTGAVGWAKLTGHWDSEISKETYRLLVPRAAELDHPR